MNNRDVEDIGNVWKKSKNIRTSMLKVRWLNLRDTTRLLYKGGEKADQTIVPNTS